MPSPKSSFFKSLLTIFLFFLLIASSKSITNRPRIRLLEAASPALKSADAVFSAAKRMIPFASLREENNALRRKVELLTRRLEEANALSEENARLKTLLDFRKTIPYTTVPAQVIGRDPTNWSNSLIIDKGLANGVSQGKAALSAKGLVGRVLEAGRFSAKILLITDPNSKAGVVIRRNRQGGILVGRPDGMCKMIYIALDSDVAPGDRVITAGFGSVYPKDIPVGEVVRVGKEAGRLYKYAVVKTAEEMSRVEEVLCIR